MGNLNIESLVQFIVSPHFEGWLLVFKIGFILFSLFLLAAIIYFLSHCNWLKFFIMLDTFEFFTYKPFGLRKIEKDWSKIITRLDSDLESEYKLAVIEVDGLLDDILKRMGYGGESLGERLGKLTSATLSNIEEIKKAHATRNNIIHDPDYRLSLDETREILAIYEQAFKNLETF